MKIKSIFITCLILIAATMMSAPPAFSWYPDTPYGLDVQILSAAQVTDAHNGILEDIDQLPLTLRFYLIIHGYNFDNGSFPAVHLAGTKCAHVSRLTNLDPINGRPLFRFTAVCDCPGSTLPSVNHTLLPPPFSALLTVTTGPSVRQFDTFNIYLRPWLGGLKE